MDNPSPLPPIEKNDGAMVHVDDFAKLVAPKGGVPHAVGMAAKAAGACVCESVGLVH